MCRRIDCPKCGRPTYAGCGAHIEQVLADVPAPQRCHCDDKAAPAGKALGALGGWLRALVRK
jgi:hypothetical protein